MFFRTTEARKRGEGVLNSFLYFNKVAGICMGVLRARNRNISRRAYRMKQGHIGLGWGIGK